MIQNGKPALTSPRCVDTQSSRFRKRPTRPPKNLRCGGVCARIGYLTIRRASVSGGKLRPAFLTRHRECGQGVLFLLCDDAGAGGMVNQAGVRAAETLRRGVQTRACGCKRGRSRPASASETEVPQGGTRGGFNACVVALAGNSGFGGVNEVPLRP